MAKSHTGWWSFNLDSSRFSKTNSTQPRYRLTSDTFCVPTAKIIYWLSSGNSIKISLLQRNFSWSVVDIGPSSRLTKNYSISLFQSMPRALESYTTHWGWYVNLTLVTRKTMEVMCPNTKLTRSSPVSRMAGRWGPARFCKAAKLPSWEVNLSSMTGNACLPAGWKTPKTTWNLKN